MIELTHIGELLIAEMLNSSSKVRELFGDKLGVSLMDNGNVVAVPEVSLASCGQYTFDGTHAVDVGLLLPGTLKCVPIEAKLGTDRLSKPEFEKRFLQSCWVSHGGTRISGSMTSILERKLPAAIDGDVEVRRNGVSYKLTPEWILVVREQVLSSWKANGVPALSSNCSILSIEEVVSAFGNKNDFNELVAKLISADYYQNWFGGDSRTFITVKSC